MEEEDDLSDMDYGSRNSMGFTRDGSSLYAGLPVEDDADGYLYQ